MTLTTAFSTVQAIVDRMRLQMPINVTLIDPVSGAEVTIYRENILAALIVDTHNILIDSQTLAAQYAEMARAQRACERAAAHGERAFVAWKAQTASGARSAAASGGGKLTDKASEEAYRTHKDYEKMSSVETYYSALAGLFEDLKKAFEQKGRMIEAQMRYFGGDLRMRRAEDTTEQLDAAAAAIEKSRGGSTPARRPRND